MVIGSFMIFIYYVLAGIFNSLGMYVSSYVCLCSMVFFFSLTFGATTQAYLAEVTVDSAMALCSMCIWASAIQNIVFFLLQIESESFGLSATFWLYAAETLVFLIYVIFVMKETKGLSVAEKKTLYAIK